LETSGRSAVPVVRSPAGARPSGPERALSGAPAAIRLFREVIEFGTDPTRPLRAVVCGPGGSGKSVLLGLLADALRGAGVTVVDDAENAVDPDPGAVVLLDDVHELDEPTLGALRRGLARPTVRVIVAHRPLSGRVGPAALLRAVQVGGATVMLGPLGRAGVADRAALLLGGHPDPALVGHVFQQTRGLPRLVDRLLTGLRDGGPGPAADRPVSTTSLGPADASPEPRPIGVPGAVLRQIRADVDARPVDLRRLVLSRALGAPVDPAVLAPVLDMPPDAAATLVDHGVAAGLLLDDGSLPPLVRLAVLGGGGVAHRAALHRRIAAVRLELGGDVSDLAHSLIGTGLHGREIAAVLERAADDALLRGRPGADDLYDAAVEAGTPAPELADRRAEAALLSGDLDAAMAAADQVLGNWSGAGTERLVRAVKVAAAVLAHRGLLARSAELHRWLAGRPGAGPAVAAVPALIGTGALAEAEEILGSAGAGDGGPPTALAGAEALLARGAHQAVVGAPTAALSDLARAAALAAPSGRSVLLADTPAALGAVVALHCGELDVAESEMERAIGSGLGGPVALPRHRLLQAWIAMQRGNTGQARTLAATVPDPSGTTGRLEPRDELMAAALEVALARRSGDLAALLASWGRAREAVVRHPVDLYSLLPLGELLVGAARLRQEEWVAPYLADARALLARLGEPPLWAAPLHWAGLQAAIVTGSVAAAEQHAAALTATAGSGRYAAALAAGAAQWLQVLGGDVDAAAVETAARGLQAVGLGWEGSRLAGQAAIRTHNRGDMSALLGCARSVQAAPAGGGGAAPAGPPERSGPAARPPATRPGAETAPDPAAEPAPGTISDREREVAELVLAGLTYKQIGEQLFISAKTVEHHMARMRQRLGSESRGELFARLRILVNSRQG
jgi:DNA-binding CsgD family transcriptional regulator